MAREYDTSMTVMDNHCHICFAQPIEESLRDLEALLERLSISEIGLLACPLTSHCENGLDILENLKVLYLKDRLSRPCFAYSSFTWHSDDPEMYADYADQMMAMGFDGFKSLEQHPRTRRDVGKGLNDPSYAGFFERADAMGSVMVCHVGDPRFNWDLSTASESAVQLGRVYGEGFLTLDALFAEMEEVIARYRHMTFILAHFYFHSDNYERVCRLLDENSHVMLDLTPGGEMYVNFTKDPAKWREFFIRYQDRIILGSDLYVKGFGENRHELARNFLEGTEPFMYFENVIEPITLPRAVIEKICHGNIKRLMGENPKPVNRALAYAHCIEIAEKHAEELTALGRENLQVMMDYWKA